MKFYNIYKKSNSSYEKCILVKQGFYWENFVFGIFWALYKKIWDLAILYALFISIMHALLAVYPVFQTHMALVSISIQFMLSFYVHRFYAAKLVSNGYEKIDFIASDTEDGAFLKFLDTRIP